MSEKTEKATPHKLKKAKEQGFVNKSQELSNGIFLFVLFFAGLGLLPSCLTEIQALARSLLNASASLDFQQINSLEGFILLKMFNLWLPLGLIVLLSLIIATLAQTGFVWSFKPLIPNFKRLNPATGFKRLFTRKTLFESLKLSLKLSLSLLLLSLSFFHELESFFRLMQTEPRFLTEDCLHLLFKLLAQALGLIFCFALIDKLYSLWSFAKENRMSKEELKDEYKQREGDPKIKHKIKQLQQQLRQKTASLQAIKTANVLITNPSHLAIALHYQRGEMPAPKIVSKVQGDLVIQAKILARRHCIPIIENKPLAQILFKTTKLNHYLGQEHFPAVASIFRELFAQKRLN